MEISRHVNSLTVGCGTGLYGAVHWTLDSLKEKYPEHEHCLVVFTDGEHTDPKFTEQQLIDKIQEQTAPTAKKPPRIFTLGLGSQYKKEVVERWSKGSGVSHIHLNTMDDFNKIYAYGAEMSRPRLLRHIVQGLFKEIISVFNDSITLVPTPLQEDEPFQFADKTFSFASRPRATLVPITQTASFTPAYNAASQSPAAQAAPANVATVDALEEQLNGLKIAARK